MQAIITKFIGATNTKGSRIKATCDRGSVTVGYPHELNSEQAHRKAVECLIAKFNAEDTKQYGPASVRPGRCWNRPFVTGSIPSGEYVHVFID